MEIGSFFEINPATVKKGGEASTLHLSQVDKYGKEHCCYTASGREAIELALISLERERPDIRKRCLLPAYMCNCVFLPFLHRGWELVFYSVDRELEAAGEEIFRLALEHDPGLIFIHPYYGADTCAGLRRQLAGLRRSGVLVMEDVTQSYYLEEAGKDADFVVGSLRKWYAVPDGGFVASDIPLAEDVLETGEEYARERLVPLVQKWEYLKEKERRTGGALTAGWLPRKAEYLKRNRNLENALDCYQGVRRISRISAEILSRVDEEGARRRREENYHALYQHICGMKRLWAILPEKETHAPLYLPVYVKERDSLQRFLAGYGIYAPVLWPVGEENKDFLQGDGTYIFEHMLALPIDQRYDAGDMEQLAEVLALYEEQPVIGIRVDVNETVATGHIMRCITIAEQIKKLGGQVLFITADGQAEELLARAGMEHVCLQSRWDHMEEELPVLREVLKLAGIKTLLVDSYQATPAYFEELCPLVKLVCIDDCFEHIFPVDVLINYNAYHIRFPYRETYGGKTRLLLGTDYVPLREEFSVKQIRDRDEQSGKKGFSVLLSSGGSDAQNAILGILQRAMQTEELRSVMFHAVVGVYHPQGDAIEAFAANYENVKVYRPCHDMAGLMADCDAAVSAAGTMLFELCAMRVPTVFFQSADNQRYDREFFEAGERMIFAGDMTQDRDICIDKICEGLKRLVADAALRERMKENLGSVTDGKGAERIAGEIMRL
ncbi:MAG: UDP-2,4-diacetamido-2,4,6-trideoxy-beta-L-altropyranose hydrolase [Lachnospiraceae bacterium]|nr:UDP-2,4-diacetamido-2,4,6-trideoxy-beta-L-altropyranose hydrolase [Lachnospiraceae bacterium]